MRCSETLPIRFEPCLAERCLNRPTDFGFLYSFCLSCMCLLHVAYYVALKFVPLSQLNLNNSGRAFGELHAARAASLQNILHICKQVLLHRSTNLAALQCGLVTLARFSSTCVAKRPFVKHNVHLSFGVARGSFSLNRAFAPRFSLLCFVDGLP